MGMGIEHWALGWGACTYTGQGQWRSMSRLVKLACVRGGVGGGYYKWGARLCPCWGRGALGLGRGRGAAWVMWGHVARSGAFAPQMCEVVTPRPPSAPPPAPPASHHPPSLPACTRPGRPLTFDGTHSPLALRQAGCGQWQKPLEYLPLRSSRSSDMLAPS